MIILYVFIVLLAIILIISAITYKIVFRKSKKDNNIYNIPEGKDYQQKKDMFINLIDDFNKISYEDVYIKSHDGLNLHARYYHIKDSAPLNICFHGYRATSTRDFCGGIKMCFDNGHNFLLILVLFPNAEHGLSYIVDENKYRKNVQDFLKKVLN